MMHYVGVFDRRTHEPRALITHAAFITRSALKSADQKLKIGRGQT